MIKNSIRLIFIAAMLLGTSIISAGGASLKDKEVGQFISTMEILEVRREEFKSIPDNGPENLGDMIASDGSLMMFREVVKDVEQYPVEAKKLLDIVKNEGFKSIEDWGETGDKVMQVYMGIQMDTQEGEAHLMIEGMQQMTPEMMAMMPEGMRKVVEASLKVTEAAGNVSPADKAILEPHMARLEAAMME